MMASLAATPASASDRAGGLRAGLVAFGAVQAAWGARRVLAPVMALTAAAAAGVCAAAAAAGLVSWDALTDAAAARGAPAAAAAGAVGLAWLVPVLAAPVWLHALTAAQAQDPGRRALAGRPLALAGAAVRDLPAVAGCCGAVAFAGVFGGSFMLAPGAAAVFCGALAPACLVAGSPLGFAGAFRMSLALARAGGLQFAFLLAALAAAAGVLGAALPAALGAGMLPAAFVGAGVWWISLPALWAACVRLREIS